ncbi:MAG: hypothetical protein QOF51_871 [Chloroflexota bacterium]|jgi:predicted TIM-barrel fold metal-dependent hydrolase|nr:hypothetical protein [Chloroflexota bacterium]
MAETRTPKSPEVRISADSHMAEPLDLWQTRLPERYRAGVMDFSKGHHQIGKGQYAREGGWDPAKRLVDMAADGVVAEVLYPTRGKEMYRDDLAPEVAEACASVYNDWMIEFCSEAGDRLWGQAEIGLWNTDHAVHELERCMKAGLAGATVWEIPPEGIPWTSDHYDPFWAAAQEMGAPVSMHINTGFGPYTGGFRPGRSLVESVARTCGEHKAIAMRQLTELICSGVFERFPELRVVLAELEVGWIPFWVEDMDRRFLKWRERTLPMLPSEYFHRNVFATFTQDEVGGHLLASYGQDNFLWSNDYPHPGCIWPFSGEIITHTLGHLDAATMAKVLRENTARIYGRPVPSPMPVPTERPPSMDEEWGRRWIER